MQHRRRQTVSFIRVLALFALCAPQRLPAAPDSTGQAPDKFSVVSPDGRFIFRQTVEWESDDGEAAFGVIDARTKRSVLTVPGAGLPPMEDSIACLWAPNSKRFAVNARVAGRYETTEFFGWTGKKFQQIPSIEGAISTQLATNRKARLSDAGIPADTVLRRLWDVCKALKWEDTDTLKVLGSSTRSYESKKAGEDTTEIVSAFTFILKFKKNARPRIIDRNAPTSEESQR